MRDAADPGQVLCEECGAMVRCAEATPLAIPFTYLCGPCDRACPDEGTRKRLHSLPPVPAGNTPAE